MEILKNVKQIYVVGMSGVGKSFFSRNLASELDKEYINFDLVWDYEKDEKERHEFFFDYIKDKENIIVDAVPYNDEGNPFKSFFENNTDIERYSVICLYFSDLKYWIYNILNKDFFSKCDFKVIYQDYRKVYFNAVDILVKNCNVYFYNVNTGKFTDIDVYYKTVDEIGKEIDMIMEIHPFEVYLKMLKEEPHYDAFYQDVELINFTGYSKSYETWNRIKKFDFHDKIVMDIGCFHGYFSFKVAKTAKKVYAVDISNRVLKTAFLLSKMYNRDGKVIFYQWNEYNCIPDNVGMILCLNVLHHFKEPDKFLEGIKPGTEVIFEIEDSQKEIIQKYFQIDEEINSHRAERVILYGIKK